MFSILVGIGKRFYRWILWRTYWSD